MLDELKCATCGEELEPGSFPQLTFEGDWICEVCLRKSTLMQDAVPEYDRG